MGKEVTTNISRAGRFDDAMRHRRRHDRFFRFARRFIVPFIRRKINIESIPAPPVDGPFLLLANHNLNLDPVIIHLSFDSLLYFVASEHVLRRGFGAWFLKRYFAPIPRLKGSTDISTVKGVLSRLKHDVGVCIFAEGNRSFNGVTAPIPVSIAKLAKICRVPVLTYRFEGGYFTAPRWSIHMRRGKMKGYVVNVYEPAELATLSVEELHQAICRDLDEDAYARQAETPIPFKGKALAEALETTLYHCPLCAAYDALFSKGNTLRCRCGLEVTFDLYGRLSGGPFTTITEWDNAQQDALALMIQRVDRQQQIFSDRAVTLKEIFRDQREKTRQKKVELSLFADHFECGTYRFNLHTISDMAMAGRNKVIFTYGEQFYELSSTPHFCGKKYYDAYQLLRKQV